MSVLPSTVNPGHFNDTLPTRTPSVSRQHTALDLNGTVTVEKFVKGGSGSRDPVLTDYIFQSYSAETYYPFRVHRNGVRQTPEIDFNMGDIQIWRSAATAEWGVPYMSSDGSLVLCPDIENSKIWRSLDSGYTWSEVPGPLTAAPVLQIVGNRTGTKLVARARKTPESGVSELYVSQDSGTTWTLGMECESYDLSFAKDTDYVFSIRPLYASSHPIGTFNAVCWSPELGLFVAVGSSAYTGAYYPGVLMTSPDGRTWTSRTCPNGNWMSVCWSSARRRFVAVADSTLDVVGAYECAMVSTDGINWTRYSTPGRGWASVTFGGANFVAVGAVGTAGERVMASYDGTSWVYLSGYFSAVDMCSVCYAASLSSSPYKFVSVVNSTTGVLRSMDGDGWVAPTLPPSARHWWTDVCWSPELGIFVAVASTGSKRVMVSSDGVSWTDYATGITGEGTWQAITWSAELGLFVAISQTMVMTSPDGTVWTARSVPSTGSWASVCWSSGLGLFVSVRNAVTTTGGVMNSADGLFWGSACVVDRLLVGDGTLSRDLRSVFGIRSSPAIEATVVTSAGISASDSADMVVCSSVPGNIFTSTDYGVSFVSRYSIGYDLIFTRGDGNAATCFRRNPTAGTVVAVGPAIRTNPTVWANGNVTPENVNYVCGHGSNQILYRTDAGCGKVFKSEDSGANWSEIVISGFEKLGPVMCPADGSFFVVAGGEASASHTFQDTGSNLYCKGDLVRYPYIIHAVQFANPATLDPGEIVTLEYLTNSTDLLPTLSPYN